MKSVLPYRLIFDSDGMVGVHSALQDRFGAFVYDLMYVNTNSRQHKKDHIITSKASFDLITSVLIAKGVDGGTFNILEPAIRPHNAPEHIEAIVNEVVRIWEHAIFVSGEEPYQTIIFTSSAKMAEYEALKTKDKKDNIVINDSSEAINKITTYRKLCQNDKQN